MATAMSRSSPGAGGLFGPRNSIAAPVCIAMGAVFVIVAIWGFITGTQVLIFTVNTAHNIVHLVSGLAALAVGFAGEGPSRAFSLAFGVVYGLVAVLGFMGVTAVIDLLNLNNADNWLHVFIALTFLAGAFIPRSVIGGDRSNNR